MVGERTRTVTFLSINFCFEFIFLVSLKALTTGLAATAGERIGKANSFLKIFIRCLNYLMLHFLFRGEHGFFRVIRGGSYDPIGCYWAVPEIPPAQY
jgi:hypothetical protein